MAANNTSQNSPHNITLDDHITSDLYVGEISKLDVDLAEEAGRCVLPFDNNHIHLEYFYVHNQDVYICKPCMQGCVPLYFSSKYNYTNLPSFSALTQEFIDNYSPISECFEVDKDYCNVVLSSFPVECYTCDNLPFCTCVDSDDIDRCTDHVLTATRICPGYEQSLPYYVCDENEPLNEIFDLIEQWRTSVIEYQY